MIPPFSFNALFAVASGAVLGALLRYLANIFVLRTIGPGFPWATLSVNLVGCLVAGMLLAVLMRGAMSEFSRLFWMVGFLGALTTFSAFSVETLSMLQAAFYERALLNVLANVLGSLSAVIAGHWLLRNVLN